MIDFKLTKASFIEAFFFFHFPCTINKNTHGIT